ncbi:MAG: response regulator [Chloroflexota bacterium]
MISYQTANEKEVTILIVEDDKDLRSGIQDVVETTEFIDNDTHYNINVLCASDGQAGIDLLDTTIPDLIISDVMMPKITGFQFLEYTQSREDLLHIPFIFLTAKDDAHTQHQGMLNGASLYLTKPFDFKILIEHIRSQLKRSFALQGAQEQIHKSFKKQILKVLNHEFRTPLTYVTSYSEMLTYQAEELQTIEGYQEHLRGIQVGCVRLSKLIDDFIVVMDLNSGEAKEAFASQTDIISDHSSIVIQALDHFEVEIEQQNVEIELNIPKGLPTIVGVRQQIVNIFIRLLDNALKFTQDIKNRPKIQINAHQPDNELHFIVADNGQGMPLNIVDNIFDLFYQYNRDIQEQQGAGVGLNIVSQLMKLHNGRIELHTQEDVGSTFTLIFPVNDRISSHNLSDWDKCQATILVVEDDPNLLDGLQDLLETIEGKYRLNVLKATNGLEGLEQLKLQLPDLIISDIMMPKMSGYEFLQQVRKKPEWLHIPVIFLTAKGKLPDKDKAYIMGVDEYITKPYDSSLLLSYVESQLDKRFALQKIVEQDIDSLKKSILNLITPNLRQPISFVNQYVEQLKDSVETVETEEEFVKSLQGIQTGSEWLNRLIDDFMSLAELKTDEAKDTYKLQSQKIPNFGIVISDFFRMNSAKFESEGIQIVLEAIDTQVPAIYGNIGQILNSFNRLIEVGVKQCEQFDPPLKIVLSVEEQSPNVVINLLFNAALPQDVANTMQRILDIKNDNVDLFRSFEFAPDLSIAQGYIALHGGHINLKKTFEEKFAFSISLPITNK